MRTIKTAMTGLILGLCVTGAAGAGAARGQEIRGATLVRGGSAETVDPGKYLGNVYKDEAAGFRITPPVEARVIQRYSVDLVSFVVDAKAWGGSLQRILLVDRDNVPIAKNINEYVDTVVSELTRSETFKGVQVLERRALKVQGHDAMRLSTSMEGDLGTGLGGAAQKQNGGKFAVNTVSLLRQQLIVQMASNQFYVLTFYTPLADRAEGTATFDAVAGSLELYNPMEMKQKRVDAIRLGKEWLDKQTAEAFRPKMVAQTQLFKMMAGGANGQEFGAVKFEEVEIADKPDLKLKSRNGFEGVQMQMYSQSFVTDSRYGEMIVRGENFAFWANSKNGKGELAPHYSMWANLSKTQAKLPGKDPTRLVDQEFWVLESGVLNLEVNSRLSLEQIKKLEEDRARMMQNSANLNKLPPPIVVSPTQYHLHVTVTGDPAQKVPDPLDMRIPPQEASPLPKIMEYVWPRLVDLTKPSEMSFVVYNKDQQKLALRTLIVTGKKELIEVNRRAQECYKCIDEMDPGSTTIWVDKDGRIVSMRTSDQTLLVPTTADELRTKWGGRMEIR